MATNKGLTAFENPMYQDSSGVPSAIVNPFGFQNTASASGSDALAPSLSDIAVMGAKGVEMARQNINRFMMPEVKQPSIGHSRSRKEFFVQGITFSDDDAQAILQAQNLFGAPPTGLPTGGDWEPLDTQSYGQLVQNIKNPSIPALAAKNFGRGVDIMQMLYGRGLQLAGAEETGKGIVAQQMEDLRKTTPYERQFTDIESGRGAVEWLVANFAQQGPNLIESIATAGLGFLAGTGTTGTPMGGAAAAFASLLGKSAWKEGVKAALSKQAKGEALNIAEQKLLREAAGIAGAVTATYGQNLATGAADIYGELRDQGADPNDVNARMTALFGSVPYAVLETLPEYLLAGRIFKGVGAPAPIGVGVSLPKRGLELLRRGAVGGGIGGIVEGTTELGQEALLLKLSDQDFGAPENVNRLINSFAAGFGVGGPIGAGFNLLSGKQPTNLLNPAQNPEPTPEGGPLAVVPPAGPGTAVTPFYTPVTPTEPAKAPTAQLIGPANIPQLTGPVPPVTPMGGPMMMVTPSGVAYPDQMLRQQGNVPPGVIPGTQGVLDVFGGQISAQELAARMQPQAPVPGLPAPAQEPVFNPAQGALQFAGPAPTAPFNTQMANQLQVIQDRIRRQREFEAAQAQQQAIIQQQTEQLARQSQNARDLYIMQQAQQQAGMQQVPMPTPQVAPTQPVQLDLFTRREAPRPSRAEALRRGVGTGLPIEQIEIPQTAAQRRAQLTLFTQEGQPSMAALRVAGVKTKVAPPAPKPRATKTPGARGLKKGARVAEVSVVEAERPEVAAQRATLERLLPKEAGNLKLEKITAYAGNWRVSYITADGRSGSSMPIDAEDLIGKTDSEIKATLADRARKNGLKGVANALEERNLKQGRVTERPQDNEGIRGGRQVGEQPKTEIKEGGVKAGGRGKPVVSRAGKAETLKRGKLKEETKPPKVVAAPAAVPTAEAWETMKPEKAPTFENLPAATRVQWRKDMEANRASHYRAAELIGETIETPLQLVNSEFANAEAAMDILDFRDAISTVVEFAYTQSEDTNIQATVMRARELLTNTTFTDAQQNAIDATLLELVNTLPSIEAVYTRDAPKSGAVKGDPKPWFDYATQRGLLPQITTVVKGLPIDVATKFLDSGQLRIANLPADTAKKYKASVGPISGKLGSVGANIKNDTRANPATSLSNYIKELNTYSGMPYNPTARKAAINKLRDKWAATRAVGMEDFVDQNGNMLSDYFDENDNPYTGIVSGQFRVATEEITTEVRDKREKSIKDSAIPEDDDYEAPFSLDDWNIGRDEDYGDGRYFRDDGTPINNPVPIGRIKILVSAFLSKLGVKPKVQIYRNQTDFKAKNPKLYAQAVAARSQGDFDTANAVGYSFGDGNVVIFADRVATEQQLKFVLAHETLGHFGFRGLLTERELNAALDAVYNSSAKVKAAVDTAMKTRGMPRREATEEYLADFAGMLDTNIIARFWNAIKNFLNKLGIRFDDDTARYLVSQSRRYVRNGVTSGTFVDFKAIAQRMGAIEGMTDPNGSGRFALASGIYSDDNRAVADNAYGQRSFKLFDVTNLFQQIKDRGINIQDYGNRLIAELRSMNYASRENLGYRALYEIFRDISKKAAQLRAQYNKMMGTVLSPAVEIPGIGTVGNGATKEQIAQTSKMLRAVNSARFATLSDAELRRLGALITIVNGEVKIDQNVYKALDERGRATLDEFKKGFSYTTYERRAATEEYRNKLRAERDALVAIAVDAKDRTNILKEYEAKLNDPSMDVPVTNTFPAMPDLTEESLEWIMYNEVRDTMNKSAIDLLLSNFTVAREMRVNVERKTAIFLDKVLSEQDKEFLGKISDKFLDLYNTGAKVDENGVTNFNRDAIQNAEKFVSAFNTALLARDTDLYKNVQEFFDTSEADDIFNSIQELKAGAKIKREDKQIKFAVQQAISNLATSEERRSGAEVFAKHTIAGGYVPFRREGSWQVRIQAVDPLTGRIYKVADEYRNRMFFAQVSNKAEALQVAEDAQRLFDSVEDGYEMEVLDGAEYVIKKVKLVAQPETARETVSTTAEANLNEIISAITRFSISITPEERKRLIVGLTRQNSSARTRLQRAGTPGEDPNTIKYVSKHLEATASTVARKENRYRLDRLFDDGDPDSIKLWYGDKVEYDRRKTAWDNAQKNPNISEPEKFAAKREFDDYHYTFITKESPAMGNRFKDRGRRAVAFMESQSDVDYTDFASGEAASTIRTATTFAFMGGSFATAILNYLSLATNVLPAFSGYNQKNAFGGGFGWGMSSVELSRAINVTKNKDQSTIKYWDDLLTDPAKLKASGFSEAEARFMQKEVGGGTMQAALTNSLLGSARGKFRSGGAKTAAETWMSLFNYTEQHSRRATGLAAFRMAYARALVEGKDAGTSFEIADKFAVDMIDNTLGEYAMYNRPAMFRGDVRQFLFVFKMFPVNSIQMLAALSTKERLLALGILAMFAGLKGLPFAEDLMDILDTIAQTLGLGPRAGWKGSAEQTLAEALDAIAPGMSPILMRGLINTITPANVSDRTSLANIAPGTGIMLAGADVGRELVDVAGPVASFLQGAVSAATNVTKWGLGTVGVLDDTTSFNKVLRESPVVMLRALGDMMAYNNAGAIVNQKGYVVTEDLHLGTMLTRALGFYPAAATAENDVVRISKRIGDYQKDIAATYRGMYVGARINKDNERARDVVQMVNDWNQAAKGTGLEIRNFEGSANRALREAQRSAVERYLKAAPKTMRPETERIIGLYGVSEEQP